MALFPNYYFIQIVAKALYIFNLILILILYHLNFFFMKDDSNHYIILIEILGAIIDIDADGMF